MRWISDPPSPFAGTHDALPFGRRLATERGHRIPVTVLTGFLGAGKSTLLRRILDTPDGADTAVVVNEIGAVGIDDALLATSGETVRLLANGCLCCTVRSDLEMTLRALHADRAQGRVPAFRRIIVETSGAADPAALLQTLVGNRALAPIFHLQAMVTVFDAVHGETSLAESPEARMQLGLADRVVVSKVDLAGDAALAAAESRVAAHAPAARIVRAGGGADAAALFDPAPPRIRAAATEAPAHGDAPLRAETLVFDAPFAPEALEEALGTLVRLRGSDLLRIKGLVAVDGCRGPVVVHGVRHQLHPPAELERWPDDDRRSRLVVVSKTLSGEALRGLFEAVRRLAPSRRPADV